MNYLYFKPVIDTQEPVMEFFEEGDWLRIEVPRMRTRYLQKEFARQLLFQLGCYAVTERSNIIVREMDIYEYRDHE